MKTIDKLIEWMEKVSPIQSSHEDDKRFEGRSFTHWSYLAKARELRDAEQKEAKLIIEEDERRQSEKGK